MSLTTSGLCVGVIVLLVTLRLVRSISWRRTLCKPGPLTPEVATAADPAGLRRKGLGELGDQLAGPKVSEALGEMRPLLVLFGVLAGADRCACWC
ncbi:MAG: hypothetical protein ABR972_07925 [Acidimicrobiales bacterium]